MDTNAKEVSSKSALTALERTKRYFFPEVDAGGFSRRDGTVEFYGRIKALIDSDSVVLDFGAGRGRALCEDKVRYRRELQTFRGSCKRVIGIDVDEAVRNHPSLDEVHVVKPGAPLPLDTESIDLIVSDSTFEHVQEPAEVAPELARVLRSGGWICARTPNRWGYIGLGTNMVPNRWHVPLLKYLQPHRQERDVFPTAYKLNTIRALKRYFPESDWKHCTYGHFAEPAYFASSRSLWRAMLLSYRFTPNCLAPTLFIFLQKA